MDGRKKMGESYVVLKHFFSHALLKKRCSVLEPNNLRSINKILKIKSCLQFTKSHKFRLPLFFWIFVETNLLSISVLKIFFMIYY